MSAALALARVDLVESDLGQNIEERRIKLGMSRKGLAEAAGVDRGRLAAAEAGNPAVRPTTLRAITSTLDRLEQEMGMDDPEDDLVEFRVSGNFGVDVVVKGPVRDMQALEESVARIVRRMQSDGA